MLGHSMNAVPVPKGENVSYTFYWDNEGEANLITALIPTQPNDAGDIRVGISIDGAPIQVVSYKEEGRTDTWKENVLRNQARIRTLHTLVPGHHTVTITALDNHVVIDQIMVDTKKNRKHYVIPTSNNN